uniref:Matrix-remodelling associated 7 n=1 Tax=Sinocyclocheilus anshuiensis TaxID=1608454 RepID=A0A671L880_9TELE
MTLTSSSWSPGAPRCQRSHAPILPNPLSLSLRCSEEGGRGWGGPPAAHWQQWASPQTSHVPRCGESEKPLRYMAGMLRTCQLEKMMTKEELEEEQRVQREQLAAIFQLLKDKQDTFGEVTESDLQEQLKLYSV